MTKFRIQVVITSLLISSLGIFLGGCAQNYAQNNKSLFSQLNGHSIIIESNNKQSMSRWISTNIKTEPNINNQLSYLESCISKKFDLNLAKGQHLPFQLQNGVQYLDPEKDKNEIKLLLYNGETGVFYVTWKYTADQQKIFDLYRKLEAIPSKHFETIKGRTTDYDEPINLSIEQVRNIIKKSAPSITNKQKSMINFYGKPNRLRFNTVQDIFDELCLVKNQVKYTFRENGALGEDIIQPKIKVRWYNFKLSLFSLKDKLVNSDPGWWGGWIPLFLDMNTAEYADGDRYLVKHMLQNDLSHFHIPEELFKYFSLSHTKLIYHKRSEATLYFKCPEEEVFFQRTIYVQGTRWRNL